MIRCLGIVALLFTFGTTLVPAPAEAVVNRYTEDFRSHTHRDPVFTTTLWDTIAGQARLHPYVLTTMGSLAGIGDLRDLDIFGNILYAADAVFGLRIVDVSNPDSPVLLSGVPAGGGAVGLDANAGIVWLATATGGLVIVDARDPSSPQALGSAATSDGPRDLSVSGGAAYVAIGFGGLEVFDASNPALPVRIGGVDTPGYAQGVAVSAGHAYVADAAGGLLIYDISDPAAPALVSAYSATSAARHVTLSGTLAFVANGTGGLVMIDVSTPAFPVGMGAYNTPGSAARVVVSGAHAYVADLDGGLVALNVSDPALPALVSSVTPTSSANAAVVSGTRVLLAGGSSGVISVRVGDQVTPRVADTVPSFGLASDLVVTRTRAYVADGTAGLTVFDIDDPTSPVRRGGYNSPGTATAVAVTGAYALLADGPAGLRIVDVSNPDAPALAASVGLTGTAFGVDVAGGTALVASGAAGVHSVDVRNPEIPILLDTWNTPGTARVVTVAGTGAWVLDGGVATSALIAFDLIRPDSLVVVGQVSLPGDAIDFAVHGSRIYVLSTDSTVTVVNGADPSAPVAGVTVPLPSNGRGVAADGDRLFVSSGGAGVLTLDITAPDAPVPIGASGFVGQSAGGVATQGEYLFVADGARGLTTLQIYNRDLDTTRDVTRSLRVTPPGSEVLSVRVDAAVTDSLEWQWSADGGAAWDSIPADGTYHRLTTPGEDLRWQATHRAVTPGVNPRVDSLTVEWLSSSAVIDSVRDVPGDNGGWVRVSFTRSGYDVLGETTAITSYIVYRRADDLVSAATQALDPADPPDRLIVMGVDAAQIAAAGARRSGERTVVSQGPFPPGTWEVVGFLGATKSQTYTVAAPTLGDSVNAQAYSVYLLSAHTAGGLFWVSAPDSGYSIDNTSDITPPAPPFGFHVIHRPGTGNDLRWHANKEPDFLYYKVYRDTTSAFLPSPATLVYQTFQTSWLDPIVELRSHWYALTAVDDVGNESAPAFFFVATDVEVPTGPARAGLHQNVPNPFNPFTVIRYDVGRGGAQVTLNVYDVSGRLIRVLEDRTRPHGSWTVRWDGSDRDGRASASGVYFYRLRVGEQVFARRMTLLR